MIMHPLRKRVGVGGWVGGGAASGKQFTFNVLMGYWLFVRPSVRFYLSGEHAFVKILSTLTHTHTHTLNL